MSKYLISCVFLLLFIKAHSFGEDNKINFDRDIRPILSDNCFHCHGPDAKNRKAKLQLHTYELATTERKSGKAIVPGDAMASDIIKRMITDDEDDIMPPGDSNRHVTKDQIELGLYDQFVLRETLTYYVLRSDRIERRSQVFFMCAAPKCRQAACAPRS